jgi:hypothetical protein
MKEILGRSLVATALLALSASLSGCIDIVQESAVGAAGSVTEAIFVDLIEGFLAILGGGS